MVFGQLRNSLHRGESPGDALVPPFRSLQETLPVDLVGNPVNFYVRYGSYLLPGMPLFLAPCIMKGISYTRWEPIPSFFRTAGGFLMFLPLQERLADIGHRVDDKFGQAAVMDV
jgi:hypothetical protein